MTRLLRKRALRIALPVVALAVAAGAWAYWTSSGSGSGSASVRSLNAPSVSVPSPSSGSVAVSWSAATISPSSATLESEITYTIERSATAGVTWLPTGGSCAGEKTANTLSCTDEVGISGTYTYRVTANFRTWTAIGMSAQVIVVAGVDSTPPTIDVQFPDEDGLYKASTWNGGCSPNTGICGTASDLSGVSAVEVSILQESSGKYWNGSAFADASETFVTATGTTSWHYDLALPADGDYTVQVRATDGAIPSNTTAPDDYAVRSFAIDATAPTATVAAISSSPANTQPLTYSVTFSEPVSDLAAAGVTVTAPAPNTDLAKSVSKIDAQHFTVSVSGLNADGSGDGSISVQVNAGAASDAAGNGNSASNTADIYWDRTLPSTTIAFPLDGSSYNAISFGGGCTPSGICGTATDVGGLQSVRLSIKRDSDGFYWDGSSFVDSLTELFDDATLLLPSATSSAWAYGFSIPTDGSYTVHVQAEDAAANEQTGTSYSSTAAFTIDTVAPSISRLVVADASASAAGFVKQGSGYYAYAQVTDAGTGVASVAADLDEVTGGASAVAMAAGSWTIGGESYNYRSDLQTANDPLPESGNPYAFEVSADDGAGNIDTDTSAVDVDNSGPAGGSVDASGLLGTGARYSTSTTLSIAFAAGTDSGSGLADSGAQLSRASATLTSDGTSDGACGTYGSFTQVGADDPSSPANDPVGDHACYTYRYVVSDKLGNTTTYTSGDVKVDTSAPSAPSVSLSGATGNTFVSGTTVYINAQAYRSGSFQASATSSDSESGILKVNFPTLTGFSSGGGDDTGSPYTSGTYSWSGEVAASGAQTVTATNNSSQTANSSFTVTPDTTNPAITASAKNADNSTYPSGTWTNQTVTVHYACSDGGSGLASCTPDETFSSEGTTASTNGSATDHVDNTAAASFGPIQIDKTSPAPTVTQINGATRTFPYATNAASVTSIGGTCGTAVDGSTSADSTSVSWTFSTRSGTATCSGGTWSASFTAISAEGSYSAQVSQGDAAGSTGSDSKTVTIDRTAPTNVLSLMNQSAQAGPAGTTNSTSFLSGNAVWYDGGAAGSLKLQNALTDSLSGPASSTFGSLAGPTAGWTFTGSSVATPAGGPYLSNLLSWTTATTGAGTEDVTGTDAAGNTNAATTLTFRSDSTAPTAAMAFPATNGSYTDAAWDGSSCSSGTICGTANDPANAAGFATSSSAANSSSGANALVLNTPASVTTNDVLVAALTVSGGSNTTITAPSGWTLIRRTNNSTTIGVASYYHVVTNGGSEPASYSWGLTSSTRASGGIARYIGVDTSNPIDVNSGGTGSSGTPTAPTATTTAANDVVVGLFGTNINATFTAASGLTERYDVTNANAIGPATEAADYTQATAAATGAKAATATASAAWAAQLVALRAAPQSVPGLGKVQVSIQATSGANSGMYWDPAANVGVGGFTSATEVLMLATGTTSWSLAFPSSNFTDAKYTVKAYAVDSVGNFATASSTNVTIDNVAPATTDNAASIGSAWRNTSATVTLTPTDTGGSGAATTYYTTNGATPTTGSTQGTSISLTATGIYTIKYFSVDSAGNQEAVKTASTQIRIDKALPTNSLALATATGAFLSGSTLYYKGNAAGSFTLVNTVTDADSGPTSTTFPAIGTTGWTHSVETVTTPSGGPYTSSAFSWTASPSTPTSKSITSADVAGNTSGATTISFTSDTTAPTGGAVTVNGAAATAAGSTTSNSSGSFTLSTLTQYTDSGSGLASSSLVREQAPLAADGTGTCGTWTTPTTISATRTESSTTGIATGNCYRYTLAGTDRVGNSASISTVVKVDTTPPSAPALTITASGNSAFVNGTTTYYNGTTGTSSSFTVSATASDAESGIQSVTFPTLAAGFTGGGVDASSPYSATYTWTSSTDTGTKTVTASNGTGTTASSTFSLVRDVAAPAAGALTVNGLAATSGGTTSTADSSTFAIDARTDYGEAQSASQSGLDSSTLTIQSETLTGSTCGAPGSGGPFTSATTISGSTQPSGILSGFCYLYTLTGTDNVGNTATVKTTVIATDAFQVSDPGTQNQGAPFSVTITALFDGSTDTGYSGSKTITFTGPGNAPDGTAPSYPASLTFTNGVATASITLFDAGATTLTATQGAITGTSPSFTVNPGSASRLAWTNIVSTSVTGVPVSCLFTCSYATFGNNANFTANVSVTDNHGNIVSNIGSGHTVSVTRGGDGGSFTAPTTGNPVSLTISSTGFASSTVTFTFLSQTGSWTSDTLTAHPTAGTVYTDATATLFKT